MYGVEDSAIAAKYGKLDVAEFFGTVYLKDEDLGEFEPVEDLFFCCRKEDRYSIEKRGRPDLYDSEP